MTEVSQLPNPASSPSESLAEQAYSAIRDLIVSAELTPGALIEPRRLFERLGIGQTPIREALRRLAQERLVEVFPRRGVFVTAVDVHRLARLSEVRVMLEPEAARLAAERATEGEREEFLNLLRDLADLERAGDTGDARELMALDEQVHRTIYRCVHNDLLQATLEQYYVLALRIWVITLDRQDTLRTAVQEHRTLLEAIRNARGEDAAKIMRAHVQSFEQAMHRILLTV